MIIDLNMMLLGIYMFFIGAILGACISIWYMKKRLMKSLMKNAKVTKTRIVIRRENK